MELRSVWWPISDGADNTGAVDSYTEATLLMFSNKGNIKNLFW
jgi:hypothetical protein